MSIDKWMDKNNVVHIIQQNTAHLKEWNNVICSNMEGPGGYCIKQSQTKKNIIGYGLYTESKRKTDTNELIYKTEVESHM